MLAGTPPKISQDQNNDCLWHIRRNAKVSEIKAKQKNQIDPYRYNELCK